MTQRKQDLWYSPVQLGSAKRLQDLAISPTKKECCSWRCKLAFLTSGQHGAPTRQCAQAGGRLRLCTQYCSIRCTHGYSTGSQGEVRSRCLLQGQWQIASKWRSDPRQQTEAAPKRLGSWCTAGERCGDSLWPVTGHAWVAKAAAFLLCPYHGRAFGVHTRYASGFPIIIWTIKKLSSILCKVGNYRGQMFPVFLTISTDFLFGWGLETG